MIFPRPMTWREQAAAIIAEATRGLPADMPLEDRMKVVDAARPHWGGCSWPRKAWQAARRVSLKLRNLRGITMDNSEAKAQRDAALPLFD